MRAASNLVTPQKYIVFLLNYNRRYILLKKRKVSFYRLSCKRFISVYYLCDNKSIIEFVIIYAEFVEKFHFLVIKIWRTIKKILRKFWVIIGFIRKVKMMEL